MTNTKNSGNLCSRCGKQRIIISSYEETVGTSVVTYTEMTCPDPDCQKAVQKVLTQEKHKREVMQQEKEKRDQERKERAAENAGNKGS